MSSSQLISAHFRSKDVALAQFSEMTTKRIMVTCFRKVSSDGIVETSKYRHLRAESTLSNISDTIGINHTRFLYMYSLFLSMLLWLFVKQQITYSIFIKRASIRKNLE